MNQIRNQIEWFKNNTDVVYLDSAATALKPDVVLKAINNYISFDCTNPHNTNSDFAYKTAIVIDSTRAKLADYIGTNKEQVIFTPGATFSLNMIADSLNDLLSDGDEILITNAEHASNILPWLKIKETKNIKVSFVSIDINDSLSTENKIINSVSKKTRIVSFANGFNLVGLKLDAKKIANEIKKNNPNVIVVVDATQFLAFNKMELKNSQIDFLVGSAHKMMGPTGIGLLYISPTYFDVIKPKVVGGGMNHTITKNDYSLMDGVMKYEAGTPNVLGIYGWQAALNFYDTFDIQSESYRIYQLKKYFDKELLKIKNVIVYNKNIESSITIFKYEGVFSQDLASYLGSKNIIVRSGLSCAKLAHEVINAFDVVRVSMHFYNTKADLDKLIDIMKNFKKGDELDGII